MKKIFTILAVIISFGAFAQQVPNGSFETWSNDTVPDHWGTWGSVVGFGETFPYFALRDTLIYFDGHTSVKLITDTIPSIVDGQPSGNPVTPSLVGLGTMYFNFASMQPYFSGIAYTKKPDSLYFAFRYAPRNPKDSGEVFFGLSKAGTSLYGGLIGGMLPNTSGQWVSVAFDIAQFNSGSTIPDTLQLFFSSSSDMSPTDTIMGSTLWVDAVHFDASVNVVSGINQLTGDVKGVNVYPNPATDKINIGIEQDETGSQVQLFDMSGREVYNGTLGSALSTIDTRTLQAGLYSIRVNSVDKLTTYKGKITVTK